MTDTIAQPVHLIDVMPTVLSLLGLDEPAGLQGRDLGPLLRGESVAWSRHSGYAESLYARLHHGCAPLRVIREDGWKVVHGLAHELYDLNVDPKEIRNLAAAEPGRSAELAVALEDLAADLEGGAPERLALDDERRRALESLGYVWSR